VVVDGEEVQRRAIARVVAGVGGGVCALAREDRQGIEEGVDGEGGVDVEVAEENLAAGFTRCGDGEGGRLAMALPLDHRFGNAVPLDGAGRQIASALGKQQGDAERERDREGPEPLHASILPQMVAPGGRSGRVRTWRRGRPSSSFRRVR